MAKEALLALIFSSIQAPHDPQAWLLLYKNEELADLVRCVADGKDFPRRLKLPEVSWGGIVKALMPLPENANVQGKTREQVWKRFADFWAELAVDYNSEIVKNEFNSIKHGFRVQAASSPVVEMAGKRIPTAENGTCFPVADRRKGDVIVRLACRTWSVNSLVGGISLMADSMFNIVEFLKVFHGVEKNFEMSIPDTMEFDLAKSPATQMLDHLVIGPVFRENFVPDPIDKDLALAYYRAAGVSISFPPRDPTGTNEGAEDD